MWAGWSEAVLGLDGHLDEARGRGVVRGMLGRWREMCASRARPGTGTDNLEDGKQR